MISSWVIFVSVFLLGVSLTTIVFGLSKRGKVEISKKKTISITRLFFISTQIFALIWVTCSYVMAFYSMVKLGEVYTLSDLSTPAIQVILGVNITKVAENIFEHNEGAIFGKSDSQLPEG